jgi:hypothetical protein
MPFTWGNPMNGRLGNSVVEVEGGSDASKFLYD